MWDGPDEAMISVPITGRQKKRQYGSAKKFLRCLRKFGVSLDDINAMSMAEDSSVEDTILRATALLITTRALITEEVAQSMKAKCL